MSKDERKDEAGTPAHPDGWYALARVPNRRRLRIDFDAVVDAHGELLLIVTAYDV